eukprot:TRINITY_DN467_c0_g1_i1.p1 TRINITY_DN467_c0_g1~~TRINITY_DN467_c0_g1_i1.p1  ORF type:complete len:160 (+),score=40.12 TRINITY_DN467_c0_g1_i1:77-556(+)
MSSRPVFGSLKGAQIPLSERVFLKHDKDSSGTLNSSELRNLAYDLGRYLSDEDLAQAMKVLDKNGDGTISVSEFKAWWSSERWGSITISTEKQAQMEQLATSFREADVDNDGVLTKAEFDVVHKKLGLTTPLAEVHAAIDSDNDGKVCFNEFVSWWLSH